MKQLVASILFLSFLTVYSQTNCEYSKEYVPANIEDALIFLNCVWSAEDKVEFKNQEEDKAVNELHFGTAQTIRNNWGFWNRGKSSLEKELESYGFTHPDDKSWIILSLFHKQLNNAEFDIKKELLKYKQVNKELKRKEVELENEIKQKHKSLSIGDTIKIPFGIMRSGNNLSFSTYSNRETNNVDEFDCIITGKINKKTNKKGFPLTIEIVDIWFKQNSDYDKNKKYKIGNTFVHEMEYFRIILVCKMR